jgi:hypothetical protein
MRIALRGAELQPGFHDRARRIFPAVRLAKDTEAECRTTKGGGRCVVPVGPNWGRPPYPRKLCWTRRPARAPAHWGLTGDPFSGQPFNVAPGPRVTKLRTSVKCATHRLFSLKLSYSQANTKRTCLVPLGAGHVQQHHAVHCRIHARLACINLPLFGIFSGHSPCCHRRIYIHQVGQQGFDRGSRLPRKGLAAKRGRAVH